MVFITEFAHQLADPAVLAGAAGVAGGFVALQLFETRLRDGRRAVRGPRRRTH